MIFFVLALIVIAFIVIILLIAVFVAVWLVVLRRVGWWILELRKVANIYACVEILLILRIVWSDCLFAQFQIGNHLRGNTLLFCQFFLGHA